MQFKPANEHAHKFMPATEMNIMVLALNSELLRGLYHLLKYLEL